MSTENNNNTIFKINDEGNNGTRQCFSIKTPGLPVITRTPQTEIDEMVKTPEKYNLVSANLFHQFVAYAAPKVRKYNIMDIYKSTFEDRCRLNYIRHFEKNDLDSYYLEEPSLLYNQQWTWFVYIHAKDYDVVHELLSTAINEFKWTEFTWY